MKAIVRPKSLRSLRRDERAVSPVVATLMLILVAVGAAAALYLWLSGWQNGVTKSVGSPNAQYSLTVGGSTTVFPLSELAIKWFEQNNTNVVVSDNQGGSGAGLLALCKGGIDIAANSRPVTASDIVACPSLSGAVQTVVGYDAVTALVPSGNTHGIVNISSQEMLIAYWLNGGRPNLTAGSSSNVNPGLAAGLDPVFWGITSPGVNAPLTWGNIPQNACYDPSVGSANTVPVSETLGDGSTYNVPFFVPGAYAGPCAAQWIGHYPSGAAGIHTYMRFDNSGTAEAFDNNMLGVKCGTDQQLASCNFAITQGTPSSTQVNAQTGNPALITAISKDPDALGYSSYGQSTAIGGVKLLPFRGSGQAAPVAASLSTIKAGIAAGYGVQNPGSYVGWRPLEYTTMGQPAGESQRYIQFVMQPGTNEELCSINFFISPFT